MHMYIKDKLSVIDRVFLRKIYKETCFFFFFFSFFFFAKFTFSAIMRHEEKLFFCCFFPNITYKEGRFYQKRSELDFRCGSGRRGKNRYPNWHY